MTLLVKKNTSARRPLERFALTLCAILLLTLLNGRALAQEPTPAHPAAVTPLANLLDEAGKNNPQIEAARQSGQAAKQVPAQVSTLPDPQFTLQHLSVGSPRPFAGYTNSEFAYIGLGVSQDIPYPGKLKLRGEIAKRESDASQQQVAPAWARSRISSRRNCKKRNSSAKLPCTIWKSARYKLG
jgi:hypothetical protein